MLLYSGLWANEHGAQAQYTPRKPQPLSKQRDAVPGCSRLKLQGSFWQTIGLAHAYRRRFVILLFLTIRFPAPGRQALGGFCALPVGKI